MLTAVDGTPQVESPLVKPLDPIEAILGDFVLGKVGATLPTSEARKSLVLDVQRRKPEAAADLASAYEVLVAGTAYPFIGPGRDSEELLSAGNDVLQRTAETFDPHHLTDFLKRAINNMTGRFVQLTDKTDASLLSYPQFEPIDKLMKLITGAEGDDELEAQRRHFQEFQRQALQRLITPIEYLVASYAHLPEARAVEVTGLTRGSIRYHKQQAKAKLGVTTTEELVAEAWRRGVQFDVPELSPAVTFSLREKQIAPWLVKRNLEVQAEFGFGSREPLDDASMSLLAKTGAETRVGVVLMSLTHVLPLDPKESLPYPAVLESYTPFQRQVLLRAHLPARTIVAELKDTFGNQISVNSVNVITANAEADTGTKNKTALAAELFDRGVRFDIIKLNTPLADLLGIPLADFLDEGDLQIIRLLALPYEQIGKLTHTSARHVEDRTAGMRRKTGARNNTELLLMLKTEEDKQSQDVPFSWPQ